MPAPLPPRIAALAQQIGALAQASGVSEIVVAVRDPQSQEVHFVAAGASMQTLRHAIGEKLGFQDVPDTSWGD